MIALLLAAALMDPGALPRQTVVSPPPEMQRVRDPAPMLQAVAVTLECTARADGRVEQCKVLGETHPGLGFGEAAIALMRDARVAPGQRDIQFARTIQFTP